VVGVEGVAIFDALHRRRDQGPQAEAERRTPARARATVTSDSTCQNHCDEVIVAPPPGNIVASAPAEGGASVAVPQL
jgi:hypothetical protein